MGVNRAALANLLLSIRIIGVTYLVKLGFGGRNCSAHFWQAYQISGAKIIINF